jgi:hypothetical protein
MSAIIISAFFCCGKTTFANNHPEMKVIDMEGEDWLKTKKGVFNPKWPNNYIQAIKGNLNKYDVIFVSSNGSVRSALAKEKIPYVLVYPENTPECYNEWNKRCCSRGTPRLWECFISTHWQKVLHYFKQDPSAIRHYKLQANEYLDTVVMKELELRNTGK